MGLFILLIYITFLVVSSGTTCQQQNQDLRIDDNTYFQCLVEEKISNYVLLNNCDKILATTSQFFYEYNKPELEKFCCKSYEAGLKPKEIPTQGSSSTTTSTIPIASEKPSPETTKFCSILNKHIDEAASVTNFSDVTKKLTAAGKAYFGTGFSFGSWYFANSMPIGTIFCDSGVYDILFKAMYPNVDEEKSDIRDLANDLVYLLKEIPKRFKSCNNCLENIIKVAIGELLQDGDSSNGVTIPKTASQLQDFMISTLEKIGPELEKALTKRTGTITGIDLKADVKEALNTVVFKPQEYFPMKLIGHLFDLKKKLESIAEDPQRSRKTFNEVSKAYSAFGCGKLKFTFEDAMKASGQVIEGLHLRSLTTCSEDLPTSFIQSLKDIYSTSTCEKFVDMVGCRYNGSFINLKDLLDACRASWTRLCTINTPSPNFFQPQKTGGNEDERLVTSSANANKQIDTPTKSSSSGQIASVTNFLIAIFCLFYLL